MGIETFIALGAAGVEPFDDMFGFRKDDEDESSNKHQAHIENQLPNGSYNCERCGINFRQGDGSSCNI